MKKQYTTPEIEILMFSLEDVIVTSDENYVPDEDESDVDEF